MCGVVQRGVSAMWMSKFASFWGGAENDEVRRFTAQSEVVQILPQVPHSKCVCFKEIWR